MMRSLALVVLLTALTPWAIGQRMSSGARARGAPARPASPRFNAPAGSFALGHGAHPSSRFRRPSGYGSLPFSFFGDSFNPDDIYSTGYPVASEPPAFLLQMARDMAGSGADSMGPGSPQNMREPASSQPLMIELQGGRYVKVSTNAIDGEALPLDQAASAQGVKSGRSHSTRSGTTNSATGPMIAAASPMNDLPSAVLVFRDGHREEVRDYTIVDGSLYVRGDYYKDGYWNKKIEISALNLAQTVQANSDRNVKFVLPSSPNEVIARF